MAPPEGERQYVMKLTYWQAGVLIAVIDWVRRPSWFGKFQKDLSEELPELRERLVLYRSWIDQQEEQIKEKAGRG